MLKYPPPWMVLCNSLEKREQVPENGEDGHPTLSNLAKEDTVEEYVTDATTFHIESSKTFDSGQPEANVTDSWSNTAASESTMDRITRRMFSSLNSSQQDLTDFSEETQKTEKIDQDKDLWVSSPDRRLKVLREEERFEIRTHLPETSPTKLFVGSDSDDDEYKIKPRSHELTPEKVQELEKKRRDLIKKQRPRKSLDTEDVFHVSDHIDLTGVEGEQNKPNIHTEQIDFESARQQFIKLEKEKNSLPIMPRPVHRQSRLNTRSLRDTYQVTKEDWEGEPHKDESIVTQEIAGKDTSSNLLRKQFFKSFSVDSVDNIQQEKSEQEVQEEKESIPNPSDETPIEREIRLALQREESLRKERGILSVGETKEIIEISKNPVLANFPDIQLSKRSKNRPLTSLFIQREIEKEVQREADLKSEGRVAGLYDKGDSQELDERRKLFEQPDEIPVQPVPGSSTKMITKEATFEMKEDPSQIDVVTDTEAKNWTEVDSPQPYSIRMKWKPAPYNVYRNRRLSADNILDIKTLPEKSSEKETSEETYVLRKENFHFQPLKFSLNVQDNDGEVEKDNKISQKERYNRRLRPSLSNIIEQEIQQTLERDRELQEERRKVGLPPLTINNDGELSTPHNGFDIHETSSLNSNDSNTWSSAPWKGTLGNTFPPSDSSTEQIYRPHGYPKFEVSESDADRLKRHENRYAGIDSSDAVNTEIVESTRVNRHKNTMALRWEAGLYANEQSD